MEPTSKGIEKPGTIDHVAIGIVGVMLLGMLIAGEWWLAGSWSELSAIMAALAAWLAAATLLTWLLRRAGADVNQVRWYSVPIAIALGGLAGAVYAVVGGGRLREPMAFGMMNGLIMVSWSALAQRRARKRAAVEA